MSFIQVPGYDGMEFSVVDNLYDDRTTVRAVFKYMAIVRIYPHELDYSNPEQVADRLYQAAKDAAVMLKASIPDLVSKWP